MTSTLLRRVGQRDAAVLLLVVPGGGCGAERYDWLFGLANPGISVAILNTHQGGYAATIRRIADVFESLAGEGLRIHVAGHSAGAAAILDAVAPGSNPGVELPDDFRLRQMPASITSLGCSLQARVLDWNLAHRHETRPLHCPHGIRLTFVAGRQDAIAGPDAVARTASRYGTHRAAACVMEDATHYGWAGARQAGDRGGFDVDPALDTGSQRERTLHLMADVLAGRPIRSLPGVAPLSLTASRVDGTAP